MRTALLTCNSQWCVQELGLLAYQAAQGFSTTGTLENQNECGKDHVRLQYPPFHMRTVSGESWNEYRPVWLDHSTYW